MRLRLFALIILWVLSAAALAASEHGVPAVSDLSAVGEEARESGVPILVMFSQRGCPYCRVVEEDFLGPMLSSGRYDDKVVIRRVMTDGFRRLTDFDGEPVEPDAFAGRYGAGLTPTVVFLDSHGRELADRVVGLTTPDFYGGKLDSGIEESLARLRQQARFTP